uniref:Transmembrane protein n=1 Tax=Marseillevirus LCMAC202 TaxID=2506606 RepID=A0A481YXD4_9VIRU|nr:MAG: hypothetical protein LCMAC202_01740 [Marseillevirus LCMAC202]
MNIVSDGKNMINGALVKVGLIVHNVIIEHHMVVLFVVIAKCIHIIAMIVLDIFVSVLIVQRKTKEN